MDVEGEPGQQPPRVNYTRRAIGAALCLAPVALLVASLGAGVAYPREGRLGLGLTVSGLLPGGFNFYLSFIRPWLYAWRHGSTEGLSHVSGIPALGTFLVVAGGVIGFCDWRAAAVGLVALALDTGGLPWFLTTWRDRSFWDE